MTTDPTTRALEIAIDERDTISAHLDSANQRGAALVHERDQYRRDFEAMSTRATELAERVTAFESEARRWRGLYEGLAETKATPHILESGAQLDWSAVSLAARAIARAADNAGFVAPEDAHRHQALIGDVCRQLDQIVTALRIARGGS